MALSGGTQTPQRAGNPEVGPDSDRLAVAIEARLDTLTAALAPAVRPLQLPQAFSPHLQRRLRCRGHRHSYLSAACATPPDLPGAVFPFARATFAFADGRTLSSTLTRSCTVKR